MSFINLSKFDFNICKITTSFFALALNIYLSFIKWPYILPEDKLLFDIILLSLSSEYKSISPYNMKLYESHFSSFENIFEFGLYINILDK